MRDLSRMHISYDLGVSMFIAMMEHSCNLWYTNDILLLSILKIAAPAPAMKAMKAVKKEAVKK